MTIARTICLGFVAVITVGTLLLILPFSTVDGHWNNPIIALFTSTSAVCVTGLTVVDTGTYFSFWGQLIITLLIQVGGLGYMTTTTFLMLLIGRRFDLRQKLAIQDSFDRPFRQVSSRMMISSIISMTLLFEITGVIFLFIFFKDRYELPYSLWLSIFHSVSAWNNAGFGLFKDNLMSVQGSLIINFTITILIIFGGLGYQAILEIYMWIIHKIKNKQERVVLSLNFKVVTSTTLFLLIFGTVIFLLVEYNNPETLASMSLKDKLLGAWFQSVTTRTAGFNTIDNGKMTIAGLLLTMGLMFIGASPSGTGGGIKTTTVRILSNCTRSVLRGNDQVILYQREVPVPLILKAVSVVFGSTILVISISFFISFIEVSINPDVFEVSFNSLQVLFEVISAFGTVGLSTGITASLSPISQILLVLTMYTGRVGVLLLMAAIVGDARPRVVQYPEESLLVG
ncbi:potassium uptake protein, TrkH family [Rippkaea orientalis PCC 8801]|uniref:Potassium uptake protein, TrkH family n=1 Tax=Rippkaea orientalis (strain PCC 8801 / RF-1) TaxID=41431 RepID=B7K5T7_RIPO1|nr:TrkH family potassium uptake protein [Rippkaea orientalis]ACK67990.1 potassium uptake protein, TrkH family [Rippkaea orientalis PCC 8801]